jgi:competence ComEA-like helix-hairpin-helix protein
MKPARILPALIGAALAVCFLAPLACLARAPWVTLQGGQLLIKRPNDGDSFHVSVAGKEYIFRLYFVDASETDTEFRDRVEEQAKYFGISVEDNVKLGDLAKKYTRDKLSEPFLVRTCWEDAMGRSRLPRYFAFVQTKDGDLGEQLVENGLGRAQQSAAKPEGLSSAAAEWKKLQVLEQKARNEKVGGWGVALGRMETRATNAQSTRGVDPFDSIFRPLEAAPDVPPDMQVPATVPAHAANDTAHHTDTSSAVPAVTTPAPARDLQKDIIATKLDVNTASLAELENIKGIGPVMAQRIIDARPFKNADELRNVKGIGDNKYEQIRPYFH